MEYADINQKTNSSGNTYSDQQLHEIAFAYLSKNKDKYKILNPAESVRLISIKREDLGLQHLNFVQTINDVPIWGSGFIIHVKRGAVYLLSGTTFPDSPRISTDPRLGKEEAETIAFRKVPKKSSSLKAKSKLVILPRNENAMTLCYLVEVTEGLNRFIYFVDATSGSIVKQIEGMPSQFE